MKKLGLIGGIGPASTVDYYNYIIDGWRKATRGDDYPNFLIDNINMSEMLGYLERREMVKLVMMLQSSVLGLVAAGAEFIAVASNTPHTVYDDLQARSPVPVVSIVRATAEYAAAQGYKKVLLLGTKFTMSNRFYPDELIRYGLETVVPSAEDVEKIHSIIFPKLEDGIVDEADKERLLKIIDSYIKNDGIDAVILGCTELPIMIKQNDTAVPVIDTTRVHAAAIVRFMTRE